MYSGQTIWLLFSSSVLINLTIRRTNFAAVKFRQMLSMEAVAYNEAEVACLLADRLEASVYKQS